MQKERVIDGHSLERALGRPKSHTKVNFTGGHLSSSRLHTSSHHQLHRTSILDDRDTLTRNPLLRRSYQRPRLDHPLRPTYDFLPTNSDPRLP
ncbi:hypothetical protein O988_09859 [Pseudogymnoascus sp. VKM F-3808]|nr:hypothetical protein O988_09859 [Pseudogymnoascus sp. VKM F-3808]